MIQVQIPKDIREYEPKFIGPFTARQCFSILAAGLIELAGSRLMGEMFTDPKMSYIPPLVIAAIPLFYGFGEQLLHMKPEVYIKEVFIRSLIYPKVRPYKTHNFIEIQLNEIEKERKAEEANRKDKNKDTDKNKGKGRDKSKKSKQNEKDLPEELRAYS